LFFVSIFDPVSTLPAGATGCEKYLTTWTGPTTPGSFDLFACFNGGFYTGVYDVTAVMSDTDYGTNLLITQTGSDGYFDNNNVHPVNNGGFSYEINSKKFNIYKISFIRIVSDFVDGETVSLLSSPTAAPSSAPLCFSGSSKVEVDQDKKVISSIKTGEEVLSYSRKTKVSKT
jgi:hypothetical protein